MQYIQIKTKLEELLNLRKEIEVVEFKEAKNSFDKDEIGKYNSALSNEANLRNKDFGWLVFGVDNNKNVIGTNYRNNASLQDIKYDIYQSTNLAIKEIYEILHQNQRVILFQISPAQKGCPTKWKGHCFGRESDSTVPLSDDKFRRILDQGSENSWLCNKISSSENFYFNVSEVLSLLDYESYFRLIDMPLPSSFEFILDKFVEQGFITQKSKTYQITNLGALLFAKDMAKFGELQYKLPRVLTYNGNNKLSSVIKDQQGIKGYASGFEGLISYILSQIPEKEEIVTIRKKTKNYPEVAIREFVANSLIHQDLKLGTKPLIEIYNDRIEISNGGSCLFDSNRIIDHIPDTRNEILANKMFYLGICEKRGSGIDRAIQSIEELQLPAPQFISQPDGFIAVLFKYKKYSELSEEEKLRACYQHVCLNHELKKQTSNESLRIRFDIPKKSHSIVSRLIAKAVLHGLIKKFDPNNKSSKMVKYVPIYT